MRGHGWMLESLERGFWGCSCNRREWAGAEKVGELTDGRKLVGRVRDPWASHVEEGYSELGGKGWEAGGMSIADR